MKIGRYQLVKRLAEGSMGVLHQAYDPQIDRMVALKVLRQDRLGKTEYVQRFLQEAKAIGRLSHPNIVTVYDSGHEGEKLYIAMELVSGKPLDVFLQRCSLSLRETVIFGIRVAEALDYAHGMGVVHRDIKPSNIIITDNYQVKITDFGIAHLDDPETAAETKPGYLLGTPLYMAPEQISGAGVDGRTDLYSLGAILYQLVTGSSPFEGQALPGLFRAIMQDTPRRPERFDGSLSPAQSEALFGVIIKSLNKNAEERFHTGQEMADALIACLRKKEQEGAAHQPPAPKGARKRYGWPLLGGGAALMGVLLAAVQFWPGAQQSLQVLTEPAGARVFVDGAFEGQTPFQALLPTGRHELKLSLGGHFDWQAQIDLSTDSPEVLSIQMIPIQQDAQPGRQVRP